MHCRTSDPVVHAPRAGILPADRPPTWVGFTTSEVPVAFAGAVPDRIGGMGTDCNASVNRALDDLESAVDGHRKCVPVAFDVERDRPRVS